MPDLQYDIVIVGGSLGGVSAASAAAQAGAQVCLLEATGWLGGQYTAQGVSKPDENRFIETVGSTLSYRMFRHLVRAYYRSNFRLSTRGQQQPTLNPGGAFPGFALEPKVGHTVIAQQLATLPNVHVRLNNPVTAVEVQGDTLVSVTTVDLAGVETRFTATLFLDATDLGDLLPFCGQEGTDWVLGAESQAETGEPSAPAVARRDWIQPITMPFAIEHRPAGEDHTIPKPANYEQMRDQYSILDGFISSMFKPGKDMWSYRQFIAAANFNDPAFPFDITMINCGSNDYQQGTVPNDDPTQDAAVIAGARELSLGYLYWLQTECPRDNEPGKTGYPELKLRTDVFDTPDGTSVMPYIRESRRIKARKTIVEQDIVAESNPGPRATLFSDSCGIGLYGMDVHALEPVGMQQIFKETRPYQIPVSALIPIRLTNLLAACKNLGVTHLTNGAYRLHPIEWNIGEAAGTLAAYCVQQGVAPSAVPETPAMLRDYQHILLSNGVPLYWWTDITVDQMEFAAVHMLGVRGIMSGFEDMSYRPNNALTTAMRQAIEGSIGQPINWPSSSMSRGQAALWLAQELGL